MTTWQGATDVELLCNSDIPPSVQEGDYEVFFLRAEKRDMWKREKLFLWFQIATAGQWNGQDLYMACNVARGGTVDPLLQVLPGLGAGSRAATEPA